MIEETGATQSHPSQPAVKLPIFSRKATGLVREVSTFQIIAYNVSATSGLGLGLVTYVLAVTLFPRANLYIALPVGCFLSLSVWVAFALLSAAIPRIGGDYTINSRILPPWLALGGNLAQTISATIGATVIAWEFSSFAISPALTVIGSATHNSTVLGWGSDFSSGHKVVVLVCTLFALLLMSALSAFGTKLAVRFLAVSMVIASIGLVISLIILAITSNSDFINTVNSTAGSGAYSATVHAGSKLGIYPSNGGYSVSQTIGCIYYGILVTIWTFWGTYLSSEFKGAAKRSRQLGTMAIPGVIQAMVILLGLFIFMRAIGYNFAASSLAGNFSGVGNSSVGSAGYVYFSALVARNAFLVTIIAIAFIGWFLPAVYINISMPQRSLLTWSFDGLLPSGLSKVNERTHTPIRAIITIFIVTIPVAIGIAYSSDFFAYLAIATLFGYLSICLVGVSAIVVKWVKPGLYKGSPAEWKIGRFDVLPFAGVGCALVGAFAVFLALYYHTDVGLKYVGATEIAAVLCFVVAAVWWLAVYYVRRRQGVDLTLAYKEIPPE